MRDLLLVAMLSVFVPLAAVYPYVGIYLWEWLSLMNPHRMVFGFAQGQQFNLIVALVTIVAWLASRERKNFKFTGLVVAIGLFSVWMTLTTLGAPVPKVTNELWFRNIKTMLEMVMILALITTRIRLQGLIWIIVVSIGFFGVKGGLFVVATGGNYAVFGPTDSMIWDNNSLALALIMIMPLLNYLRLHTAQKYLRWGLIGAMILILAAIIGSYSRGGFLAMAAMLGFMWLRSRAKAVTGVMAALALVTALAFMPQKYIDRMSTMKTADSLNEDVSFQGRLHAWEVAWRVALDSPLGAGFDGPRQPEIWDRYRPDAPARASHSVYFMVLGEHGIIGLGLYFMLLAIAWWNLSKVARAARDKPKWIWAKDLAAAMQIAIVGFLVGGAALPMAYYDGFLSVIAMTGVLARLATPIMVKVPRFRLPVQQPQPAAPVT